MIKEVLIIAVFVACTYVEAQNPLALMALMKSGGTGSGSTGGGRGNVLMKMLNHPFRLCKETENKKPLWCRGNNMCNFMSIRQYGFPNLMKCSPLGMGCCIKDFASLQLVNMVN